jgi:hypothetical protein
MYLGGVNRGIAFTKAGAYTTGLVLLLGFFATGSGYNGLFLALGFGLSFLLISGLLSEKTIQAADLTGVTDVVADANTPFPVHFLVTNRSDTWFIFSLENLVTTELPKFKLLKPEVAALMEARLFTLPPGQTLSVPGRCHGLPRGRHCDFYIIQRTLFPFGMISKFKVGRLSALVSILPRLDETLFAELDREVKSRLTSQPDEQEFHSHRPLVPPAPPRLLDQKKNAGRPREQWVMKVFESPTSQLGFWIDPDWRALVASASEADYEKALSRLRAAVEAIRPTQRSLVMRLPDGKFALGAEACLDALVRAPRFDARLSAETFLTGSDPRSGWYLRLAVSPSGHHWDTEPQTLPGAS